MKSYIRSLLIVSVLIFSFNAMAQKESYWVSSGEMIFGFNETEFTQAFMDQNPGASIVNSPMRFTIILHYGQYFHHNFNNNLGFYTGLGLRNVGMITDEVLPQFVNSGAPDPDAPMQNYKLIRRQYLLGIPLALKIGSFNDNFHFFAGGELEWAFIYKQKYWNSHDRGGEKTSSVDWFGSQTPAFMPSVFAGIQMPGGVNLRFKYYLNDFLNHDYKLNTSGNFNVGDLTRYKKSQVMYVSLCWQMSWDRD